MQSSNNTDTGIDKSDVADDRMKMYTTSTVHTNMEVMRQRHHDSDRRGWYEDVEGMTPADTTTTSCERHDYKVHGGGNATHNAR